MTTEFAEKSAELAEALEPTLEEIQQDQRKYHELKFGVAYVVEATGEAYKRDKYDKELKGLNDRLRKYVEAHGELQAFGDVPALALQGKSTEHADPPAVLDNEPDVFYALVAARAVKIDCKLAAQVLNPEQAGRFKAFVHRMGAGEALTFKKVQ